ncbi:MAG: glycoside hydrolase family 9 protein [Spirochaetia bacterium]|nr:glycoside hydrolase family 9 protein [Spirochaetia bacterium]
MMKTAAICAGVLIYMSFIFSGPGAETSGKIRLNSIGYMPGMEKKATVAGTCGEFAVKRYPGGNMALKGRAVGPYDSPETNEAVYIIDFTSLDVPGEYYIEAVPAGRSCRFKISPDVYDRAFYDAMRGMYLWRCGIAVRAVHEGVEFSAGACHLEDAYLDFAGGTGKKVGTGGWHDAGDYGKYTVNAGISAGLMLKAWEHFGGNIKRIRLDIPESGTLLPDMLSEIKWETDWLLKMQADDGSVYHKISTQNFPGAVMPDGDKLRRYFVPWSSAATASFAAVMACASRAYMPYDTGAAQECLAAAEKSGEFLERNRVTHKADQKGFSTGTYDTGYNDDRLWALAELWDATGEEKYLKAFEKEVSQYTVKFDVDWDWGNVKNLAMITYLFSGRQGREASLVDDMKKQLIACADKIVQTASDHPYARPLGSLYYWGCNGTVARQTVILQAANRVICNRKYTDTAADALSHLFGRNTYCRSYVTGLGHNPPMHTHDRRSMADGIARPWPGYLVGGGLNATGWSDDEGSFSTNEIAINWNASLIYALAGFLHNGHKYTPAATGTRPCMRMP